MHDINLMLDFAGKEISVAAYFKRAYGTALKLPNLPLAIVSKRGREIALPPELCVIKSGALTKRSYTYVCY